MRLVGTAALGLLLALGLMFGNDGLVAQTTQPPTEMDLCRQQLAAAHDTSDTRERKAFLALAEQHAAAEARQATLIEWLKAAQAGAKP